ncbi:hypothetical protein ACFFQW_29405 [Umezawaea endophytica]|uniref:Uncharacterized protein n=1 Tax=Umezawaea endophytica TaxID=1654476 RepID=A0A9X3ACM8_9PSEU|nr:hypothetical protein [Umezawaea endophytica]MCS7475232.1 hypothetical protein [Umezawaea endophytica]
MVAGVADRRVGDPRPLHLRCVDTTRTTVEACLTAGVDTDHGERGD